MEWDAMGLSKRTVMEWYAIRVPFYVNQRDSSLRIWKEEDIVFFPNWVCVVIKRNIDMKWIKWGW